MTPAELKDRLNSLRRGIVNAENMAAYKVIQLVIEAGIESGEWKPGSMIPPERILATALGVSVGTAKKAILNLVDRGVLYRRQGSGTYVAAPSFIRPLRRYYLFLNNFSDAESPNTVTLESIKIVPPEARINQLINASPEDELVEIVRIFREGNDVAVLSRSYLNAQHFSGLEKTHRERFEQIPLFVILEEDYNQHTAYSNELIGARKPDVSEAALLGCTTDTAILSIITVNFTNTNLPYEYRESLCLSRDKYMYRHVTY